MDSLISSLMLVILTIKVYYDFLLEYFQEVLKMLYVATLGAKFPLMQLSTFYEGILLMLIFSKPVFVNRRRKSYVQLLLGESQVILSKTLKSIESFSAEKDTHSVELSIF